jgi:phosphoglycerol transferase MdoB-like AlkP superfamily enzyme
MDYTDFALQQFFQKIKTKPWFENTLFVVTADHCSSISEDLFYIDGLGRWQIPILVYDPGNPGFKGKDSTLMQQMDIMPTLLDYLGYEQPFFSLGNSAFDSTSTRFFFSYLSGNFNVIKDSFYYKSIGEKFSAVYKYPEDQRGAQDLGQSQLNHASAQAAQRYTQAFAQLLYNGMINDELNIKTYRKGHGKR